jgi:hypothetical protein
MSNKKSIRIIVQPVVGDGTNFSYSSSIFVRAINDVLMGVVENADPSKDLLGEGFAKLWGEHTADRKWRFKQMKNIFDSPDIALTHSKQAIVDFFGSDFFDKEVEIILMNPTFVLNSTVQDLPIEYVSNN